MKRYFQEHQWIIFFLYGSNNPDSVVFGNAAFGEIKDHNLKSTHFQKILCYGSFRYVSTLRKKVFSGAPVKCFSLMNQITQILLSSRMTVLPRSKITVWEQNLFKKKICYGSFGFVSTLRKKVFLEAPMKCDFLFMAQITQILLFSGMPVLQRSKITVWEQKLFKKKFFYGSFWFVSTLRKKVFSEAPMKCFFLYGSNNSDFVVFVNTALGEIKDHSLTMTPFEKKFAMEVLSLCLPYVKRYFQEHQLSVFFFMNQITQILLFSIMTVLQKSKITVWAQ